MAERGKAEDMQNFQMNMLLPGATYANAPEYTGRVETDHGKGSKPLFSSSTVSFVGVDAIVTNSIVWGRKTEPMIKIGITQSPPWALRFAAVWRLPGATVGSGD